MKIKGIVTEYDNYTGEIEALNGMKYLLLKNQTISDVTINDEVIFEADKVETNVGDRYIARFVKKTKRY